MPTSVAVAFCLAGTSVLTDIEVEDFQAVRKASLKLGRLTVVTGPTGSGKSAVIRAMKLVAFNARGIAYVRHGAKQCQVALGFRDEAVVVAVRRGARGADQYRVVTPGPEHPVDVPGSSEPQVEIYTKLAGGVPSEVQQELRLGEVNFAGQFDRPYLLSESGGQVARVLGELTNVTLVLDAAREANRRKLEVSRELRAQEKNLAEFRAEAVKFRTLKVRRSAWAEAAAGLEVAHGIQAKITAVTRLATACAEIAAVQERAAHRLTALAAPSAGQLDSLQEKIGRLSVLYAQCRDADQALGKSRKRALAASQEEAKAHQQLHQALAEAGVCPTCGQAVGGSPK